MALLIPDERSLVLYGGRVILHYENAEGCHPEPAATPSTDGAPLGAFFGSRLFHFDFYLVEQISCSSQINRFQCKPNETFRPMFTKTK